MARRSFFPWDGSAGHEEDPGTVLAAPVRHRGTIPGTPLEDSLATPYLKVTPSLHGSMTSTPFRPASPT
jgi:hypothetical protein